MKPLFQEQAMEVLRRHVQGNCLLVFDFDGVLAPHVAYRTEAHPRLSTLALLETLRKQREVAVVTGRSLPDIKSRVGFRARYLVGNHGVEGLSEFREQRTQARQATRAWRKQAEPILKKIQGADLEDKELSLTIHYRFSKRPRQAKAALLALAQVLKPTPRLVLGKWVVNLVWPGSATKGSAVQALMKRSGARRALYVGDDVTDEDVFRLPSSKIFSIRVGRKLRSLAPFYIPAQRDVDTLLRAILRFID